MRYTLFLSLCMLLFSCQEQTTTKPSTTNIVVDSVAIVTALIDSLSSEIISDSLNASLYFDRAQVYLKSSALSLGSRDLLS